MYTKQAKVRPPAPLPVPMWVNEQLPRHQLTDAEKLTGSSNESATAATLSAIAPCTSFNTIAGFPFAKNRG